MENSRRHGFYKDVPDCDWDDWGWQLKNRLTSVQDVVRVFNPSAQVVEGMKAALKHFRMSITPYYASLIDIDSPYCPVKAQAIPSAQESQFLDEDIADPLEEDRDSPAPGLTHRYPDRVLLMVTDICSMYCRHCTRRRVVGHKEDTSLDPHHLTQALDYIRNHKQIRDVIISGGDPLSLSDKEIERIVAQVRAIPHVEIIRIGTRMPVVLPMRITPELVTGLRKYHPLYIDTHFNHAREITPESSRACQALADGGFPVFNQSVLLRQVNDCPHVIKELNQKLLTIRVRPYYLYQCDLSRGIGHFRTSLGRGIQIMEALRGHTSGLAVPTFVVDLPGGAGKVPVMPNYKISESDDRVVLRNYEGAITVYMEPHRWENVCGHDPACEKERYWTKRGPGMLMTKPKTVLEPRKRNIGPRIVGK
ncbi:MAG: lysine 2,3-aminomutase [Nitrospinota bacterium]|nr:lysine 2,3-aminomutase [Nitrospinota bacterium]MDH5757241.1 lysine 2,3-aminomutase [Nitrospinota bacterium]